MNIFSTIWNLIFRRQKSAARAVSPEMQAALETWLGLYADGGVLKLPSAVAAEQTRLMLSESVVSVNDERLNDYFQEFRSRFFDKAETALALGGAAFKPYISNGRIAVDIIRADRFVPTAYDTSGNITAAVFMDTKAYNGKFFTRLEMHTFNQADMTYTVENKAYCSFSADHLGNECSLADVPEWEQLQQIQTIAAVKKPLFAVFRVPSVNHADIDSPLGASVYADAVTLFDQAERQWERLMWEFEGTELAIDASEELFGFRKGKLASKLSRTFKRLFRRHNIPPDVKLSDMIQVFSPAIRDSSIFNGFNRILQRIEFSCGLAYGTISDPQTVEKTAEEIRTSKQRSYAQTVRIQQSLESALSDLLYAMTAYADLYGIGHENEPVLTCTWGDSVLEDTEKEFLRRMQLSQAGYLRPELMLSWYFGCDEESAKKMMPPASSGYRDLFGGDE